MSQGIKVALQDSLFEVDANRQRFFTIYGFIRESHMSKCLHTEGSNISMICGIGLTFTILNYPGLESSRALGSRQPEGWRECRSQIEEGEGPNATDGMLTTLQGTTKRKGEEEGKGTKESKAKKGKGPNLVAVHQSNSRPFQRVGALLIRGVLPDYHHQHR